jgi:GT2 family glycosyltransferase
MVSSPLLSVILVNYRGKEFTIRCLHSLYAHQPSFPLEIIVVDNHSDDGSVDVIRCSFPRVTILELPENKGFGFANNEGAAKAHGEYLFFLNNDTEIENDCFTPIVNFFSTRTLVGIVGPKLIYGDRGFQLSFGKFPTLLNEYRTKRLLKKEHRIVPPTQPQKVDWVTGAALCMPKQLFTSIGRFDQHYFMYFEDADLCKRVTNEGYSVWYVPSVSIIHHKGKSYTQSSDRIAVEYRKSQLYYYQKHGLIVEFRLLKFYLFLKYGLLCLQSEKRAVAKQILKLLHS